MANLILRYKLFPLKFPRIIKKLTFFKVSQLFSKLFISLFDPGRFLNALK